MAFFFTKDTNRAVPDRTDMQSAKAAKVPRLIVRGVGKRKFCAVSLASGRKMRYNVAVKDWARIRDVFKGGFYGFYPAYL